MAGRAAARHPGPAVALASNDADGCFEALGDSVISDSTYTNVNHFRTVLLTTD